MKEYNLKKEDVINKFFSNINNGLDDERILINRKSYGENVLTKSKEKGVLSQIFTSLKEPMILILLFSFVVTFGINLGKFLKTSDADFTECIGILLAISISIFITIIMEGSSKKAFKALNSLYENNVVKVIRNKNLINIKQSELVSGDIVLIESGDKIFADGRIITSNDFVVDESTLTGESRPIKKDNAEILKENVALADRKNCVFSGTFCIGGNAKIIVTNVGDNTEMGKIAKEIKKKNQVQSPLNQKLNKLSKTITIVGISCAVLVFLINILRLILTKTISFFNVQELFISSIMLIVAAVPEGLPTIVAVSLALNMIKLAKKNALIKKMIATETAGCVSVICSDKTGTITKNKMTVDKICSSNFCNDNKSKISDILLKNFVLNSTANVTKNALSYNYFGSATECALLETILKNNNNFDIKEYRKGYKIIDREQFNSDKKLMFTTIEKDGKILTLLKGASEKVLEYCDLSTLQKIRYF